MAASTTILITSKKKIPAEAKNPRPIGEASSKDSELFFCSSSLFIVLTILAQKWEKIKWYLEKKKQVKKPV
jgi:hypothetical protein